jgi:transposase
MENSLAGMCRPVRRRLERIIRRSRDALVVRRAVAVLSLGRGNSAAEVARETGTARSSIQNWKWLFIEQGEAGLQPRPRGPRPSTVTSALITRLLVLLEDTPADYGYLRSTWTSELLALLLKRQHGFIIHASTVRRLLNRLDWVWRRARPTLCIRDPRKRARMAAINRALQRAARADTAVLYIDEADVDLNPRIGALWTRRGQQVAIPTPGKNRKRYLAGALDAHRGTILFTEGESKNTDLYLRLLEAVEQHYATSVRTIYIVLDNYGIHTSRIARAWAAHHPRIRLLFQPAYHPWVNVIERLWKAMHDTITRNHRFTTLDSLMKAVRRFLRVAQPFPGNQHALAKA